MAYIHKLNENNNFNNYDYYSSGSYGESYVGAVINAESSPNYDLRLLSSAIEFASCIAFSLVKQRQQALTRICDVPREAQFAVDRRFPLGKGFIIAGHGPYGQLLLQIKSALAYKDRDKENVGQSKGKKNEPEGKNTPGFLQTGEMQLEYQNERDAQVSFYAAIAAFQDAISRNESIWQRKNFEYFFNLYWSQDSDKPKPPPDSDGSRPRQYTMKDVIRRFVGFYSEDLYFDIDDPYNYKPQTDVEGKRSIYDNPGFKLSPERDLWIYYDSPHYELGHTIAFAVDTDYLDMVANFIEKYKRKNTNKVFRSRGGLVDRIAEMVAQVTTESDEESVGTRPATPNENFDG